MQADGPFGVAARPDRGRILRPAALLRQAGAGAGTFGRSPGGVRQGHSSRAFDASSGIRVSSAIHMFERFTHSAIRCLFVARARMVERGAELIDSGDLLAGIVIGAPRTIRRLGGNAAAALTPTESVEEVLQRLELQIANWERRTSTNSRFTKAAADVLTRAVEESDALMHNYVGPEHLLAALLYEEGTEAWRQLTGAGLRLSDVRERMAVADGREA